MQGEFMKSWNRRHADSGFDGRRCGLLMSAACLMLQTSLASAEVDLSGSYSAVQGQDTHIRIEGPDFVDYTGIPLSDQARAAALSYSPENISEVDRQCVPYKIHYLLQAFWGIRVWATTDPLTGKVVAWNYSGTIDRQPTTIWMDGRKPPADTALATPGGFTTGTWRGNTLVATTTHLQDGLLTRNGVPASDKEVVTMFLTKVDNVLTITGVIQDPVFLTAPYVLTNVFAISPNQGISAANGATLPATCMPAEEVPSTLNGNVPSYLSADKNPNLNTVSSLYRIPQEAALGGEQTMYPEYSDRIKHSYQPPTEYCKNSCCDTAMGVGGFGFAKQVLQCK
jgi:hypothetical protein